MLQNDKKSLSNGLYEFLVSQFRIDDVINADLMARTIFNIKLRLSTELEVKGCGSVYNPVIQ